MYCHERRKPKRLIVRPSERAATSTTAETGTGQAKVRRSQPVEDAGSFVENSGTTAEAPAKYSRQPGNKAECRRGDVGVESS